MQLRKQFAYNPPLAKKNSMTTTTDKSAPSDAASSVVDSSADANALSAAASSAAGESASSSADLRRRKGPGKSPYTPNAGEKYMSSKQRNFFRDALVRTRTGLVRGMEKTVTHMREEPKAIPDENDRASKESEFAVELRERDRDRALLRKVDKALEMLATSDGGYGFCEECGCEIGVERLLARPVATLCIECKRLQEQREKMHIA